MPSSSQVIGLALPGAPRLDLSPELSTDLLRHAQRMGVWPAVWRNLFGDADKRILANTAHNIWLRREEARLVECLTAAGVAAKAVKGATMAECLYPDLGWREIQDIDLVVDAAGIEAAISVLRAEGLTSEHDWRPAALARQLSRCRQVAPEIRLTTAAGLPVELHWDWPEKLGGGELLTQPTEYLVYLCGHAAKHFWSYLKWTCDIELFLQRFGVVIDWELFWRVAAHSGVERGCAISMELCRRWFGRLPVPGLEQRLNQGTLALAEQAQLELLDPAAQRWSRTLTLIQLARWRDRPGMLWAWISPQPEEWNETAGLSRLQAWILRLHHFLARWAPGGIGRLSPMDWRIFVEAYLVVGCMEIFRRLAPSRWLMERPSFQGKPDLTWTREELHHVAWLVDAAANRQPVKIRCLTRSLALAWMLRRRGIDVDVRIGIKADANGFTGHAWVEWEGQILHDPGSQAVGHAALVGIGARE